MKAALLGAATGIGAKLAERWTAAGHAVTVYGRPVYSLDDVGSMVELGSLLASDPPDVFVLNAFNHKQRDQQQRALELIWPKLRCFDLSFVVVSSISATYLKPWARLADYAAAKRELTDKAVNLGTARINDPTRKARMVVYEPCSFPNVIAFQRAHGALTTYVSYDDGFKVLEKALELNLPMVRLAFQGWEA